VACGAFAPDIGHLFRSGSGSGGQAGRWGGPARRAMGRASPGRSTPCGAGAGHC